MTCDETFCGGPRAPWLPPAGARLGVSSSVLRSVPHLPLFLDAEMVRVPAPGRKLEGVVGWGRKPSSERSRTLAARKRLPFWVVEDGFLRSVGLGKEKALSFSV